MKYKIPIKIEEFCKSLELIPIPGIIINNKFRIFYANKMFLNVFGINDDSTAKSENLSFINPLWDTSNLLNALTDAFKSNILIENFKLEKVFGNKKHILVFNGGIVYRSLNDTFMELFVDEITEEITVGSQLKENREKVAFSQLAANIGTFEWDIIKDIVEWSPELKSIYGTPNAFNGTFESWMQSIMNLDRERINKELQEAVKTHKEFIAEYRININGGGIKYIGARGQIFYDNLEKASRMIGINIDITSNKLIQDRLKQNEDKYKMVVENVTDLVSLLDEDGRFIYVSPSYQSITGYLPNDLIDHNIFEFIDPEDLEFTKSQLNKSLSGELNKEVFRFFHKKGHVLHLEGAKSVIKDDLGNPLMLVMTARDITDTIHLIKQKDEFIAIASHELKTPVTSIKAYAQILEKRISKNEDSSSIDIIRKMENQIGKLTNLIIDLIDVTKIEAGKIEFNPKDFVLEDSITEQVEIFQNISENHKIVIKGNGDGIVFADRERIGQVFMNFLTNAIKYSQNKTVVNVYIEQSEREIKVIVEDFGIGISKNMQKSIFEKFYRVSGQKNESYPGLGLGLYISSEIIKREKGTIGVNSIEGKGSQFYFTLPLK